MKNKIKKLAGIVGILSILYWIGLNITTQGYFVAIGLLIIYVLYVMTKKEAVLLKEIDSIKNYINTEKKAEEQNYSYKLEIKIAPEWGEITKKIFKNTKLRDKSINKEDYDSDSLLLKRFRFVRLYESSTDIDLIWSDFYKTFIKELEVGGYLFKDNTLWSDELANNINKLKFKTSLKHPQPYFFVTPEMIGFDSLESISDYKDKLDKNTLAYIPFNSIKLLLISIGRNLPEHEMNVIKKFPKWLEEELNKWQVKYEPDMPCDHYTFGDSNDFGSEIKVSNKWYDKSGLILTSYEVDNHVFKTKYFSIYIKIQVGTRAN